MVIMKNTDTRLVLLNALGFAVMSFVGIIDDMLGGDRVKGLKGHLKSLFQRRLTTGGLKAVMGGMTAGLISAVVSANLLEWALNCILIMLLRTS